jgi:hypothetical protein
MLQREVQIGETQVIKLGEVARTCPIVASAWCDYGVTCGELGTTNGHIRNVVDGLIARTLAVESVRRDLEDPSYDFQVTISGKKRSLTEADRDELFVEINDIYRKIQVHAKQIRFAGKIETHALMGRLLPDSEHVPYLLIVGHLLSPC